MSGLTSNMKLKTVAIFVFIMQVVFVILMAVFAKYDETADAGGTRKVEESSKQLPIVQYYAKFQDVNVMIFVGFGFLMTFLKRYGFSSFGINMMLAVFVIEWATILHGISHMIANGTGSFDIHIKTMFSAQFAAAAILISFGAVLGKTSLFQLIIMAFIEVIFQHINEYILGHYLKIVDIGGSMLVHAFGAYFGLAVARVLYSDDIEESKKEGSVYHSDLFSLIGTAFLWVYWPSFNAALAEGDYKHRAVINTFYALAACTVATFVTSIIVDKKARLDMVHVQNATLAGGVAVGTAADLMIHPYGAMVIGMVAGILSVVGYKYITPFLTEKLKIHDTCGVNNLHGMPAILAGISGAVACALANEATYGVSLYSEFSARAPVKNSTALADLMATYKNVHISGGDGRSAVGQGGYQALGLLCTILIALISGAITGFIMRLGLFNAPKGDSLFDDTDNWNIPDDGFPAVEIVHVHGKGADSETRM